MTLDQSTATGITLTEAAANKVQALAAQEDVAELALRISVAPGGCAGLRYQLSLDEEVLDGDVSDEFYGVKLVTDRMSAPYLQGATIDFVDSIQQVGFTIDNPNATGTCACGHSFN
jgi:iron-sulfur cluster assembly accessory protein